MFSSILSRKMRSAILEKKVKFKINGSSIIVPWQIIAENTRSIFPAYTVRHLTNGWALATDNWHPLVRPDDTFKEAVHQVEKIDSSKADVVAKFRLQTIRIRTLHNALIPSSTETTTNKLLFKMPKIFPWSNFCWYLYDNFAFQKVPLFCKWSSWQSGHVSDKGIGWFLNISLSAFHFNEKILPRTSKKYISHTDFAMGSFMRWRFIV